MAFGVATSGGASEPELVVDDDGTREWRLNGRRHRDDGPAVERPNGTREWWLHGERHRDDEPAIEWADGTRTWWRHGALHREDGPAGEHPDGTREWYWHGEKLSESEYAEKVAMLAALRTAIEPGVRSRVSALAV